MKLLFYSSPDFSDNAFYLYQYLRKDKRLKFYWIVSNNKNFQNDEQTTFLTGKSDLSCLKDVDITFCSHTSSKLSYQRFNKNHLIINLSHGIGIKGKKEVSQMNTDPHYPSTLFDYIVSLGGKIADETVEIFNNMPDRSKILPLGYPRNDHLFNTPKRKKGLLTNIIYMPTFKQSQNRTYSEEYLQNETGLALFENRKDLLEIDKWLKSEGINIHLKLHRLQKDLEIYGWIPYNLSNFKIIRNSDLCEDFYLSLQHHDALLTDYSSISIDWLALDRPEGFIFTDLEQYERSRGEFCCDPIKYSAGHHIYSMDDFKAFCMDVKNGVDIYSEKRDFVKKSFFKNPDGNSAERIYQFIKKMLK